MEQREAIDADRVMSVLGRRVLKPEEQLRTVTRTPPWLTIDTDQRRLNISRAPWLLLSEPWIADAVLVEWQSSAALYHADNILYGVVMTRDGDDYFLAYSDDDLSVLGARLTAGMDPVSYAELVALFKTAPYAVGELLRDPARFVARFPLANAVEALRPPTAHRSNGCLTVTFQSYDRRVGESEGYVVVREWTVTAPPDRPAGWHHREVAQVPF